MLFFSKFPRRKQHQSRNLWFLFGHNRKLTDTCFGCWTGNHVYSCHLFKVSYHEHGIYPGTIMYIVLYNNYWFDSILKHDTLTMSHGVCLGDILDSCHYFYAKESKICKHQGLSISQSMVIALTGVNYSDHKNIGYFLHNQWLALTMLTEQPAPEFNLQNIISTTPIS